VHHPDGGYEWHDAASFACESTDVVYCKRNYPPSFLACCSKFDGSTPLHYRQLVAAHSLLKALVRGSRRGPKVDDNRVKDSITSLLLLYKPSHKTEGATGK
jgi:hypothetical protein